MNKNNILLITCHNLRDIWDIIPDNEKIKILKMSEFYRLDEQNKINLFWKNRSIFNDIKYIRFIKINKIKKHIYDVSRTI
jgi:hypothetical protein